MITSGAVALLAIALLGLGALILITTFSQRRQERFAPTARHSASSWEPVNLPPYLGVYSEESFRRLAARVETAMPPAYHQQLKQRVLQRYPRFSDAQFEWALFELKRYFLMNLVLRGAPMFSETCDDVWHEMLMFTREYQAFCERIAGVTIHHTPYAERTPMPDERAWFDWVYTHLFTLTPHSARLWRGFFRTPFPKERIEWARQASDAEIRQQLFNDALAAKDPDVAEAIQRLIEQLRREAQLAQAAEPSAVRAVRGQNWQSRSDVRDLAPLWMGATVLGLDAEMRSRRDDGASYCGAWGACDSRSDANGDSGDSGGDGGSCGSSCGSSCGGGCGS